MDQDTIKYAEKLFSLLDTNKNLRFLSTNELQRSQLDEIDADINERLKKIYVHD